MRRLGHGLISDSLVYGLGGMASQALTIVLVPIYARQLGVANYGTVAIVNTTLTLGSMIVSLALPQAFFRSYLNEAQDDRERAGVLFVSLSLRLIVSALGLLLFWLAAIPIASGLFGGPAELTVVALIGPVIFFDTISMAPLSYLRAERRPRPYVALAFLRAVLGSALIIIGVVVLHQGVLGVVAGSAVAAFVAAAAGVALLARERRLRFTWDPRLVSHMLAFSLPLVPAAVAGWGLTLSDRYLLQAMTDRTSVGIYSAGYTVGLVINALAIQPFALAWGATYWELARRPEARQIFARVLTWFTVVSALVALTLSAAGTDAIRELLGTSFSPGRFVVPFSAFAYVLSGIYTISAVGLNLKSQTRWLPLTLGVAAIGNVALNLFLIPAFGLMGAAYSTLVSYLALAVLSGLMSQRYYPIRWQLWRVATALGLAFALAEASLLGPDQLWWRLLTILAYPPLVVLLRIVRPAELRSLLGGLRAARR
ncbi:MAG: oligosaccharide flippase family protein [Chloroflexota bacterium]|nr:oligosaccharide flippase family protein [Chloroflexota bacterium]